MRYPSNTSPWEVLSRQEIVTRWPWFRISQEHVRLPNGVEIPDFYRIDIPDYVTIFALTPDQRVVMVEQYRHGPQIVSLELPAGGLMRGDEVDTPLEAAMRELLEETGMVAETWTPLNKMFIEANRGCGWSHNFLATGVIQNQAPDPDPTELITTRLMTLDELRAAWMRGKIYNVSASAVIGVALAHLEQD